MTGNPWVKLYVRHRANELNWTQWAIYQQCRLWSADASDVKGYFIRQRNVLNDEEIAEAIGARGEKAVMIVLDTIKECVKKDLLSRDSKVGLGIKEWNEGVGVILNTGSMKLSRIRNRRTIARRKPE